MGEAPWRYSLGIVKMGVVICDPAVSSCDCFLDLPNIMRFRCHPEAKPKDLALDSSPADGRFRMTDNYSATGGMANSLPAPRGL